MITSIRQIFAAIGNKLLPLERRYPWLSRYPDGIEWKSEIPVRPVTALLDDAETQFSNVVAIDFLGKTLTYQELAHQVRCMAAGLQRIGVKKGSKVGIFLPNSPQFVITYYAVLKAGGTVVNFNPLYPIRDIKHQLNDAGVEVMVTFALKSLLGKLQSCRDDTPLKTIVVAKFSEALTFPKSLLFPILKWKETASLPRREGYIPFHSLLAHDHKTLEPVVIEPQEDVAVLQYTGGTTGVPKGTMLTHANVYANAVQSGMWFTGLEPGKERMLGVLPCFHVFAMTVVMNLSIHKGVTMILHPQFHLKNVLRDIARKKPTIMPGVPTMYNAIIHAADLKKYDLTSLKLCFSGGAGLPREIKERFEKLTGCKLVEGYGLSESAPVVAANPLWGKNKTGSIGIPYPGTIIEVVDIAKKDKVLSVGKTGEICIRGPQVMKGYWNRPDETAKTLMDGRLHTGDVGYMDKDGYFFIIDRLKEMIISGGYNIYPRNIEEVLYIHKSVLEAAVVGVADEHWGQRVKAYVVLKPGETLTKDALLQFLQDKLPRFALPSEIEFRESLPKTLIGKISKKDL